MPKFVEVNQNFFKKWSPEMAYVLGFFTADGCLTINPRGSHYIEFANNDKDVLEKIKKVMKSQHKIGNKIRHEPNQKNGYRLQIGSKIIFQDLVNLGFTVNKSKTVQLPDIPNKFFIDFLRGYFDGDGCISCGRYYHRKRISKKFYLLIRFICYNKFFLEKLSNKIQLLLKTQGKTIFYHSNAYALAYSTLDSIKIIKQFYKTKDRIWMNRKYNSCQRALLEYLKQRKLSSQWGRSSIG